MMYPLPLFLYIILNFRYSAFVFRFVFKIFIWTFAFEKEKKTCLFLFTFCAVDFSAFIFWFDLIWFCFGIFNRWLSLICWFFPFDLISLILFVIWFQSKLQWKPKKMIHSFSICGNKIGSESSVPIKPICWLIL